MKVTKIDQPMYKALKGFESLGLIELHLVQTKLQAELADSLKQFVFGRVVHDHAAQNGVVEGELQKIQKWIREWIESDPVLTQEDCERMGHIWQRLNVPQPVRTGIVQVAKGHRFSELASMLCVSAASV